MTTLNPAMAKWKAIIAVYMQEGFAYRANGFIWILTDCVPAMIMPLVFIAAMGSTGDIRGMDAGAFVLYYLTMLVITNFVTSHFLWDLAFETKEGIITVHLLRPVSYLTISFLRNLSWRVMRTALFLPFLLLLSLFYWRFLTEVHLHFSWQLVVSVILGHLVRFTFIFAMSMLALFFQETRSIFELYYFPMLFLSGSLIPVRVLPDWAISLAHFTPFYYTVSLPTELAVGQIVPTQSHTAMLIQIGWILFNYSASKVLFHYGMRQYTAVGM